MDIWLNGLMDRAMDKHRSNTQKNGQLNMDQWTNTSSINA